MRQGLVRNSESNEKDQKKATFVIEDTNKSTAEVFSRLQLGKYIPARINFWLSPTKTIVRRFIFSRSYKLRYYWRKLSADPKAEQCGWLKDKYGVSWQIVPTIMDEMLMDKDKEKVARETEAFLK